MIDDRWYCRASRCAGVCAVSCDTISKSVNLALLITSRDVPRPSPNWLQHSGVFKCLMVFL